MLTWRAVSGFEWRLSTLGWQWSLIRCVVIFDQHYLAEDDAVHVRADSSCMRTALGGTNGSRLARTV